MSARESKRGVSAAETLLSMPHRFVVARLALVGRGASDDGRDGGDGAGPASPPARRSTPGGKSTSRAISGHCGVGVINGLPGLPSSCQRPRNTAFLKFDETETAPPLYKSSYKLVAPITGYSDPKQQSDQCELVQGRPLSVETRPKLVGCESRVNGNNQEDETENSTCFLFSPIWLAVPLILAQNSWELSPKSASPGTGGRR